MDWDWARRAAYSLCRRRGLRHEDAEDAAQIICERIARLGHDGVGLTYLLAAARNASVSLARRRTFDVLPPDYALPAPHQDPHDIVCQRERLRSVRRHVSAEDW